MIKSKITFLLFLMSAALLPAQRVIIDSGHNKSVGALHYHGQSNSLISADDSGLVKIWDMESDKLEYQLDTGLYGSIEMKLHPGKTELAILVNRPGYSALSVWNWKTGKNLFTKRLTARPIQFNYSGKGKFLFITRVGNPSIVLYDSQSGREYSYLKRLNGLFSYGYIGSTESTIMTYSNSGYFRYFDIRTSSLKNESSTMEDLSDIMVLQSEGKRYILARKDESIFMIDRLSGAVKDAMTVENMISYSIDQSRGVVSVVKKTESGRLRISHSSTKGAFFSPIASENYLNNANRTLDDMTADTGYFRITDSFRAIETINNRVFFSDASGNIWQLDKTNMKPIVYKKNELAHIQDIEFNTDTLYILSESDLYTLKSEFFGSSGTYSTSRLNDLSMVSNKNPLLGISKMESYEEDKLLIWSNENNAKGYVLYSPENNEILGENDSYTSALKQIKIRKNQVLALESSGEASLSNLQTGIREFGFSALGMVSLNFLDDKTLIGGKSLMKTSTNPLLAVQLGTGEITPLSDNRFLIYNILSPEKGNRIYTAGLKLKTDGTISTEIRSHKKDNPSEVSTIYSKNGEWINSIFTVDSSSYTPTLFGSITGRDIIRIRGTQKRTWSYNKNIENMFYHNSVLYIINSDGSLTLFDPQRGKKILDYYLLGNGSWISINAESGSKPVISDSTAAFKINSFSTSSGRSIRSSYSIKTLSAPQP
jgi:hypothetical protein